MASQYKNNYYNKIYGEIILAFLNQYDINIKIDNTTIENSPSSYSFIITDSIYKTYPEAEIAIEDITGVLQEYFTTVEGLKYTLSIGYENEILSCPFIIKNSELSSTRTAGYLSGIPKVYLIHDYFNEQTRTSNVYTDRISNIVRNKLSSYPFRSVEINDTGNSEKWYQTMKNDVNFINENLIPLSFSNNSSKSPFYFFINANNEANFRNFYSMYKEKQAFKLYVTSNNLQGVSNSAVLDIKMVHTGIDINYQQRNIHSFLYNNNTGDLENENLLTQEFPQRNKSLSQIANSDNITSYTILPRNLSETARTEAINGLKNYLMKKSMIYDRLIISTYFNPKLTSGKRISLTIPSTENPGDSNLNFSGNYIIEKSNHVWDSKTAYTTIVVGRKDTFLPERTFKLKDKLLSGG